MTWTPREKPKIRTCPICEHPQHDKQCFAMGVSRPCPCGPGVTSKDHLDEIWIERNQGTTPQWH